MKNKLSQKKEIFNIDALVPGHSVDCVILGFEDHQLKVLIMILNQTGKIWARPG